MSQIILSGADQAMLRMNDHVDRMQEASLWLVSADSRFRPGDRIQLGQMGWRAGLRQFFNVRGYGVTGNVVKVGEQMVTAQMEGRKRPVSLHHAFLEHTTS